MDSIRGNRRNLRFQNPVSRLLMAGAIGLIFIPLAQPYLAALFTPNAWPTSNDGRRVAQLFAETVKLALFTCGIALPLGIAGSLAFVSRWSGPALTLFAMALTIPLPIIATAGSILELGGVGPWNPFASGMSAAVVAHAWVAVPWVAWIVGPHWQTTDRAYDDDQRTQASMTVRAWYIFRDNRRAIWFAALWVAAQTTSEIVVTDMARVRTVAEEAYLQFVAPGVSDGPSADLALSRAVAATALVPAFFIALIAWLMKRETGAERAQLEPRNRLSSKTLNAAIGGTICVAAALYIAIPVVALARRALAGAGFGSFLAVDWLLLGWSVAGAVLVGAAATIFATSLSVTARGRGAIRIALFVLAAASLAVPGPVIGVGIHNLILRLVDVGMLRTLLYDGPSPLPVWWAHFIRGWPLAMLVMWPAVGALPRDFGHAARLESDSAWTIWRHALMPWLWRPMFAATLLVAAVSLGEVSASKIVATPGGATFVHDLFSQMHFGIKPELAASALAYFGVSTMIGLVLARMTRLEARSG